MGPNAPAATHRLGAVDCDGHNGSAGLQRQPAHAAPRLTERARTDARPLREHQHDVTARQDRPGGRDHLAVGRAAVDRKGAERIEPPAHETLAEEFLLGHVVHRPPRHRRDHEGVQEAAVVGRDNHRPFGGNVLAPDPAHTEVGQEKGLEEPANQPVDKRVDTDLARARVQHLMVHRTWRTRCGDARYSCHVTELPSEEEIRAASDLEGGHLRGNRRRCLGARAAAGQAGRPTADTTTSKCSGELQREENVGM